MTSEPGLRVPSAEIADICRRHGIQELSIFGSAARNELRPDSDVDVMIEFFPDTNYGVREYQEIEDELAEVFGRRVDLGTKKYIKPHVKAHILKETRILYAA